jgi:hypothetical protein
MDLVFDQHLVVEKLSHMILLPDLLLFAHLKGRKQKWKTATGLSFS